MVSHAVTAHMMKTSPTSSLRSNDIVDFHSVKPLTVAGHLPIDPFSGKSPDVLFEVWMPGLHRAAEWNGWNEHETFANEGKRSLDAVTVVLCSHIDPSSGALVARDFRHTSQQ